MNVLLHVYSAIDLTPQGLIRAARERLAIGRIESKIESRIKARLTDLKIGEGVVRVVIALSLREHSEIIELPSFPVSHPWASLGAYAISWRQFDSLNYSQRVELVTEVAFECSSWRQSIEPKGRSARECARYCYQMKAEDSSPVAEYFETVAVFGGISRRFGFEVTVALDSGALRGEARWQTANALIARKLNQSLVEIGIGRVEAIREGSKSVTMLIHSRSAKELPQAVRKCLATLTPGAQVEIVRLP